MPVPRKAHKIMPQERLQKIIARAGIASRRHAEQLIASGQVRVNGHVITELGTKADIGSDRIEAAGRVITSEERRVHILLNKPPEIVATMADPEGRKTLRNLLRGLPERVYPVGRLDYDASGLGVVTEDGARAAEMLKRWQNLPQVYHVKVKGRLTPEQLDQFGREADARMRPVRQPDSARGHGANFWYEVELKDSKRDALRRVLFAAQHPVEKLKRIAIGPLTLEGLPPGHYRTLNEKEVIQLRRVLTAPPKSKIKSSPQKAAKARSSEKTKARSEERR